MRDVDLEGAITSAPTINYESKRNIYGKEIVKIQCLFRSKNCFSDPQSSMSIKNINGEILCQDLEYIADIAAMNYRNFVHAKSTSTSFVPKLIYLNENEAKENETATKKSITELKQMIFRVLEGLQLHTKQTYTELFNKEISQKTDIQEYLDFYDMLKDLSC